MRATSSGARPGLGARFIAAHTRSGAAAASTSRCSGARGNLPFRNSAVDRCATPVMPTRAAPDPPPARRSGGTARRWSAPGWRPPGPGITEPSATNRPGWPNTSPQASTTPSPGCRPIEQPPSGCTVTSRPSQREHGLGRKCPPRAVASVRMVASHLPEERLGAPILPFQFQQLVLAQPHPPVGHVPPHAQKRQRGVPTAGSPRAAREISELKLESFSNPKRSRNNLNQYFNIRATPPGVAVSPASISQLNSSG